MASTSIIFDLIGRDRASKDFDKVGNSAEGAGGKLAKLGKVGKLAGLGLAAVGVAAVGAGTYVFNYGAKLQQMGMKAETVFGGQLGSVEKWADKNAHAMGLTTREATGLAAGFADLLIPMGFSRKEAAKMSTDVVGLSGALSQWSGGTKSAAEVTEILNSAMLGETDGLKALGISISAADVEARLLAKGQDKLTGSAKQQAEAQAIQALIMAKSADAQAAYAKGGSPLLSTQAKLKATFGEVRDELVTGLLPAVTLMADWFMAKGLPAIKRFGAYLGEKLPPIFTKVKAVVSSVMASMQGDVGGKLTQIKGIFLNAVSIIQSLWSAFGGNITQYLKAAFTNIKMVVSGAFTVISGIFKTVSALLKGDWSGAWNGIKQIVRGGVQIVIGLVRQLGNLVRFAFKNLGVAAKAIFSAMWTGIKSLARSGAAAVVSGIKAIPGKLKEAGKAFLNAGKSLIGKLWEGIKGAAGKSGGFVSDLLGKIKSGINNLLNLPLKTPEIKVKGVKILGSTTVIPAFRRGGIAPGGTALVGEEGPELVDLPSGSRVTPHRQSMARLSGGGGGGETVVVQFMLDGKVIEQSLIKRNRDTGRPLVFKAAS